MFRFNISQKQLKNVGQVFDVIIVRAYIIYNTIDDLLYVGSTTLPLTKRFGDHIYALNKVLKVHCMIIWVNGLQNYKIILQEYKK